MSQNARTTNISKNLMYTSTDISRENYACGDEMRATKEQQEEDTALVTSYWISILPKTAAGII